MLFFRVNLHNPADWKRLHGDTKRESLRNAIFVQRHYALKRLPGNKLVVSLAPATLYDAEGHKDSLLVLTDSDFSGLLAWDTCPEEPVFTLPDNYVFQDKANIEEAIGKLISSSAWPGTSSYFVHHSRDRDSNLYDALVQLERALVVARISAGNGRDTWHWQFTREGFQHMLVGVALQKPRHFMEVNESKPKEEYDVWELYSSLQKRGWAHKQVPISVTTESADKMAVPYVLRSQGASGKVFWTTPRENEFRSEYLLVLLLVDTDTEFVERLEAGGARQVYHLKSIKYYQQLLRDRQVKKQQTDLVEFEDIDKPLAVLAGKVRIEAGRGAVNYRLEKSFRWGVVSFKYRPPTKKQVCAGYQADCPRRSHIKHLRSGNRTMCCKTLRFLPGDIENTICRLKYWAVRCMDFDTKATHQKWTPSHVEVPADLDTLMIPVDREDTDVEEDPKLRVQARKRKREAQAAADTFQGTASSSTVALPKTKLRAKARCEVSPSFSSSSGSSSSSSSVSSSSNSSNSESD
jgi:hypothetical protein